MKNFLLLFVMLFAFGASAEAGAVRLKVKRSSEQPEITAILGDSVFAQFTAVDLNIAGAKTMTLSEVEVRAYSSGNTETTILPHFFKSVCLIANTSPGNSSVAEMSVVAEMIVDESVGQNMFIYVNHVFEDDAKFTVVAIPREDVFYQSDKTIGLAVVAVKAVASGKTIKARGKLPIMGTEQLIKTTAYAGKIYWNKQQFYDNGNFYQSVCIRADIDIVVKKIVFADLVSKDAVITTDVYGGGGDYPCVTDKMNGNTACNFYKKRELSAEETVGSLAGSTEGIYLPAGYFLYIVCKNDVRLVNQFSGNNHIVAVGKYLNYRYAPIKDEGEGKACFLAGTMVKMSDGTEKPIEDIKIGDSVWIGNGKSDKVKRILSQNDPEWLCIVAGKQVVFTVPDQLFFVVAHEADGKPSPVNEIVYPAIMVKVGDMIRNDKGELVVVTTVSRIFKNEVPKRNGRWRHVVVTETLVYSSNFSPRFLCLRKRGLFFLYYLL